MAEALLKKLRPDLQVDSAGTQVETKISEETQKYLAKQNATQYLKKTPESLKTKRLNEYDLIVAMERPHKNTILNECPECRSKIIVWNVQDLGVRPLGDIEKINTDIREKVTKLAESL